MGTDDVLDDYVLTANISDVTELVLFNKDIQDLTALQDFIALKTLIVADNPFSQIDVSKNKELEVLLAGGANLTTIDISNNNKLTELDINGNDINIGDIIIYEGKPEIELVAIRLEGKLGYTKLESTAYDHSFLLILNQDRFEIIRKSK